MLPAKLTDDLFRGRWCFVPTWAASERPMNLFKMVTFSISELPETSEAL